ncbi:hypothetical protein [uncultured Kordia sp.]|uniref:hypothetical protein n=1 Tax=uncultured Kordia sp. TaxID=507699 RepID=UPI002632D3CA|nr:hypothetical protein [uncultured Kordia sp.]
MFKYKYLLLTVFCLALFSCGKKFDATDGRAFIKNAQEAIQQNDLALAESYLDKASKSDYGFCGNSWAGAKGAITLIQAEILNKKKKHDEALQLLEAMNGCPLGADCNKRDSLKIETLFLKHGKDKVVKAFQSVSTVKKHVNEHGFDSYSVYIEELAYTFTFGESFPDYKFDENDRIIIPKIDYNNFFSILKAYNFYALLEN